MTSNHTLRPWKATHFFAGCYKVEGPANAQCRGFTGYSEGDARLIAAAPEMLAALKYLRPMLDALGSQVCNESEKADLDRLIAKAEGADS